MFDSLRGSKVMRQGCVIALITEEPDDRIGHVRTCGGDGRVIGCLYPELGQQKAPLLVPRRSAFCCR